MDTEFKDFRPHWTCTSLKYLLFITFGLSLLSILTQSIFVEQLGIPPLNYWLSLKEQTASQFMIWQTISYVLIQKAPMGLDLNFLVQLAFNAYLLWVLGSALIDRMGEKDFFRLYFGLSFFVALSGLVAIYAFNLPGHLAGNTCTLFGLLVIWSMLYPDLEVLLFLTLPVKVRYLSAFWLVGALLIYTSSQQHLQAIAYLSASLCAYVYGVTSLNLNIPFQNFSFLDLFVRKIAQNWPLLKRRHQNNFDSDDSAKIIPLPLDENFISSNHEQDEQFIDDMLAKISKDGKASLTWQERSRLREISKRSPKKFDL